MGSLVRREQNQPRIEVSDAVLGSGGMARVFRGRLVGAAGFERPIAVKELLPPFQDLPLYREYLIREAKLLSRIHHPNVIQVLGVVEEGGIIRVALEHVSGINLKNLGEFLERERIRLSPALLHVVILDLLRALAGIRSQFADEKLEIVHRDLCPENLLIDRSGTAKLLDFGVAKIGGSADASGPTQLFQSAICGKFDYMAPEQRRGEPIDAGSDLYSVGVIHRELLDSVGDSFDAYRAEVTKFLESEVLVPAGERIKSAQIYIERVETIATPVEEDRRRLGELVRRAERQRGSTERRKTARIPKNRVLPRIQSKVAAIAAVALLSLWPADASRMIDVRSVTVPFGRWRLNDRPLSEAPIRLPQRERSATLRYLSGGRELTFKVNLDPDRPNHLFLFTDSSRP